MRARFQQRALERGQRYQPKKVGGRVFADARILNIDAIKDWGIPESLTLVTEGMRQGLTLAQYCELQTPRTRTQDEVNMGGGA